MASSSQSCGVCDLRHINKPSIIWCMECDEGLCKDCQEHHSLSKGTRNHNTIKIKEYRTLPNEILKITQYCRTHNDKFIMYCRKHERPCCRKCIVETHKECLDIDNLEDVIHNVKTSNAFHDIEETLVEVAENLKKISQHQQKNLLSLKEKRKQIQKEIQKTRSTINNHLDKIQEDLIKQLKSVEETENSKVCQLLSSLEQREKEITEYQQNIASIKQHASDLQIFLSLKQIEEDINMNDKFLQSAVEGDELQQCHLEYRTNIDIQNIMSNIKSFGEVQIQTKPCSIVLSRKKTTQAQIMVPNFQSTSIESIKLKMNKTVETQGMRIFGCCLIQDGRMAFTYYFYRAVRIFSDTGLKQFEVKMPCYGRDILYVSKENNLAVLSGGTIEQFIVIINVERKQITKTISVNSYIHGMALRGNRIIYSCVDDIYNSLIYCLEEKSEVNDSDKKEDTFG
ncbi:E3 ubiquitin-protein ligase TRIM45-like [Mytilus trossulus]|uniref:E3 ubiquitin-protein ligase TRIM45-like n=1 Tax=Mytilus trossulus TaxID=6551 RepID=UPI0030067C2A